MRLAFIANNLNATRALKGKADGVGGASATGMPEAARCRSARMSAAVWYRSPGDLAIAFSTIASAHGGTSGSTLDGGTGFSRTCW